MCAILVCHFIALKHLSVCTGKTQRRQQTNYPHSRSQHLDSWILLRGCLSESRIQSNIIFQCATQFKWYLPNCYNAKWKRLWGKLKLTRLTEKFSQSLIFLLTWKIRSAKLHCGILNQNALQWPQVSHQCPPLGERLPLYTWLSASHLHVLLIVHTNAYIHLQRITKPCLKPFFCCSVPPHQNTQCKFSCLKFLIKTYQAVSGTKQCTEQA